MNINYHTNGTDWDPILIMSYVCHHLITKSCLTLYDPIFCIFVARQAPLSMGFPKKILEWVAISFQRIFRTQGSNLCLLYWQVDVLPLSHKGNPTIKF